MEKQKNKEREEIINDFSNKKMKFTLTEVKYIVNLINKKYSKHFSNGNKLKADSTEVLETVLDIIQAIEYLDDMKVELLPEIRDFYNKLFYKNSSILETMDIEGAEKAESRVKILGLMVKQKGVDILKSKAFLNNVANKVEEIYLQNEGIEGLKNSFLVVSNTRKILIACGFLDAKE